MTFRARNSRVTARTCAFDFACLLWLLLLVAGSMGPVHAVQRLQLDGRDILVQSPLILGCTGLLIEAYRPSQCMAPAVVPTTLCPQIIVDNNPLIYQQALEIFENDLVIPQPPNNCQRPAGLPLTIAGDRLLHLGDQTIAMQSMALDVANWRIEVTTVDGDVFCPIFADSFE